MATETGYNGYKNYETWAVCLWLDNDQGLYNAAREMAAECLADHGKAEKAEAIRELAAQIKQWFDDELRPELGANVFSDLLNAALCEVDWHEVASTRFDE